ncbi:PEP-CTERM sorting domain-containing protein [Rugamonas aquatica]|uniref:PEP-CTERM sorting domain-containing protein n=1 Tax=Rugamonas aquatica TaxID=2743357 RepID=A0A6A7N7U7_9BURK|nr:PEP-CTERM sorting domain-containing protein [Rugamonas aquatica]MQA40817.1 PEP-CTERM sorting domain-containing protein [Rugamonas aquatica]
MRRIALVLVSLFLSASASAEIITFEYTGVINTLRETIGNGDSRAVVSSNKIPGGVRVGNDFHGTYSIDTNSAVAMSSATTTIYYNWAGMPGTTSITFDKSGTTASSPYAAGRVYVSHDGTSDYVSIDAGVSYGTRDSSYQNIGFNFSGKGNLSNLAIPTSFNVADWYSAEATLLWNTGSGYIDMTGMLTSVNRVSAVPEPESYAMLLAGLGLVAGIAARRKQQRG